MDVVKFLNECDVYPRNFAVRCQVLGRPECIPTYFRYKSDAACYRDYLNRQYGDDATAWIEDVRGKDDYI